MTQIKILSDRVANQIAAGEVIERPVAVVKELIENSIDAGASKILVEIKNGGKSFIKVTDNGVGMDPDEALISLERHATSKLKEANDLNEIRTYGFRGEALPSIASVSNFILKTRTENALEGTEILISAGKLIHNKFCGMPPGTSIEVSQLFKGVPARRKFLKSEATESAHIYFTIRLFALAHPTIAFELIDEGRSIIRSPACTNFSDRISEIWNQNISKDLLPIKESNASQNLKLTGLISKIGTNRSTRREMIFFVNNRPVENRTLSYAVLDAYAGRIPKGKFPIVFLFIDIDPSEIDVNVHPTKREIKFRNETSIRQFMVNAVHAKLEAIHTINAPENKTKIESFPEAKPIPVFTSPPSPKKEAISDVLSKSAPPDIQEGKPINKTIKQAITQEVDQAKSQETHWQFIQTLKGKFALYQTENGLVILNILRANQRIHFEKIIAHLEKNTQTIQELLLPIQIELEPLAAASLEEHIQQLNANGFGVEAFGRNTYRIFSIPNWLDMDQAEVFLKDLIEHLRTRGSISKNPTLPLFWDSLANTAVKEFYFKQLDLSSDILKSIPNELFKCQDPLVNPLGKKIFWEIEWTEIQKKMS